MIWLAPALLTAFGAWSFYALSRIGTIEGLTGFFILITCSSLAMFFSAGVIACAYLC